MERVLTVVLERREEAQKEAGEEGHAVWETH